MILQKRLEKPIKERKKESFIEDEFRNKYGFILEQDKIYLIKTLLDDKKNWQIEDDTFIRRMKYPKFDKKIIESFLLELGV